LLVGPGVVVGVAGTAVVVVDVGAGVVGAGVVGAGVVGAGVVGAGVVGAGVVGAGVVGAGVVGAGVVGAAVVVLVVGAAVVVGDVGSGVFELACGPTPAGVRVARRDCVAVAGVVVVASAVGGVVGVAAAVVGSTTLSVGSGSATRTSPRGSSFAVRDGGVAVPAPPAVTRATPSPEPEMITAVAIRNAARRPGSSRR
jgi:hypothetical protein